MAAELEFIALLGLGFMFLILVLLFINTSYQKKIYEDDLSRHDDMISIALESRSYRSRQVTYLEAIKRYVTGEMVIAGPPQPAPPENNKQAGAQEPGPREPEPEKAQDAQEAGA